MGNFDPAQADPPAFLDALPRVLARGACGLSKCDIGQPTQRSRLGSALSERSASSTES